MANVIAPFLFNLITIIKTLENIMSVAIYLLTVVFVGYVLYTVYQDQKKSQ